MKKIKQFLTKTENVFSLIISIALSINMTILANRKSGFSFFTEYQNPNIFYFVFLILFTCLIGLFYLYHKKFTFKLFIRKSFLTLLPFEIVLLLNLLLFKPQLNVIFFLFAGSYAFIGLFCTLRKLNKNTPHQQIKSVAIKEWFISQNKLLLTAAAFSVAIFLFYGSFNLAKFSAVDEPLWTFDRIPSYWKNISQMQWIKTNISDKPGITVALISGTGLTQVDPKKYDPDVQNSQYLDTEEMNFAFRFPLLLFGAFSLLLFYFLLERLLNQKSATLATVLIGSSPILIGMSRIINPDALLWIFAPLSILSFLVYQKRRSLSYLYLSALLLGLAILTKYVANILFIFFLLLLILEYVFNQKRYDHISLRQYLLSAFYDFLMLIIVSLGIFYILYPATWMRPTRLFEGTVLSQAFTSTWPLFASIFLFLFADIILFKNKLTKKIIDFFITKKNLFIVSFSAIILGVTIFVLVNVYFGMNIYNFEQILASPKTSYKESGFLGFFVANFYPLIFAILPFALFSFLFTQTKLTFGYKKIKAKENFHSILFLGIFIVSYYLGTTINNVAATNRYQIMLYPIILIISAFGILEMYKFFEKKYSLSDKWFFLLLILVMAASLFSLHSTKPFYLSYASSILPQENYLDVKDMGPGSYEVAEYLNSLPDAENISVWTDKKGVCVFFKGHCYGDLSHDELKDVSLDYVAVSWGRKSRTTSMINSRQKMYSHPIFNFAKYYDQQENVVFELLINNRPSQYIKVIRVK